MGRKKNKKRNLFIFAKGLVILSSNYENSPMVTVHLTEFKWLLVKSHFVIVKTLCYQMDVTRLICVALESAH